MQKIVSVTLGILWTVLLIGCGGKKQEEAAVPEQAKTVIEIQKDGTIIESITEEFSKEYYEEEGLKSMILTEAASFNKGTGEGSISVEKLEHKDGLILVVMKYGSADAYTAYNANEYNQRILYFGTVKEAFDAGYSLDVTMTNVKNGEAVKKDELMQMGESYILIVGEPAKVKIFGRISYVGENVTAEGKNTAILQAGEDGASLGQYYIIFK